MSRSFALSLLFSLLALCGYGQTIVCAEADSNGVASAWSPLSFSLRGLDATATDGTWTFQLAALDGGMQTVATSSEATLQTGPVGIPDGCAVDGEGFVSGSVSFRGTTFGDAVEALYSLRLDARPRILDVAISEPQPCAGDEDYFDVDVDVRYAGSNHLYLTYRQEYIPLLVAKYSSDSCYVHYSLKHLDAWGYVDIVVKATNAYGSTIVHRYIPAKFDEMTQIAATRNATVRFDGRRIIVDGVEGIGNVRLYNSSGRPVSHSIDGNCITPAEPVSGLLILRMNTDTGLITRSFVAR